jgi:RNA polymerase sigma factor (sigma-70 family)
MSEQVEITRQTLAEFEAHYRRDLKPLMGFVISLGASFHEAEDVAQVAMKAALLDWPNIDHPRAFVRQVARRVFLRSRGKAKREREVAVLALPIENATTGMPTVTTREVLNAIRSLPPAQREVMAWTIDGYEPSEIAALTGKSSATVRSHLRHARATLKGVFGLREEEGDGPSS